MDVPNAEAPPERFVADATHPGEAAALEDRPDREPELTLYHGMSISGHAIDSLPAWVEELQNAPPGSSAVSFSSDRFASIEEGEKQLWIRTSGRVANELQTRFTKSTRWRPATDFLNSPGLILERCVERTTLDVGQFVEPMYRVHWKVSLSESVKESLVAAHRPLVQEARLQQTALSFLSATALLAFVNVILRLAPCPNGKQPPSETSVGI